MLERTRIDSNFDTKKKKNYLLIIYLLHGFHIERMIYWNMLIMFYYSIRKAWIYVGRYPIENMDYLLENLLPFFCLFVFFLVCLEFWCNLLNFSNQFKQFYRKSRFAFNWKFLLYCCFHCQMSFSSTCNTLIQISLNAITNLNADRIILLNGKLI